MKKTKQFTMRLSDDERTKWRQLASDSHLNLADYIRQKIQSELVGREPIRQKIISTVYDANLTAQIAKFGNLTNQLCRWVNSYKSKADAVQVITALIAIERQLTIALDLSRATAVPRNDGA